MSSPEWMKNPFYQLIAAIICTALGTTAITVKFGRPNAFTSVDWAEKSAALEARLQERIERIANSVEKECALQVTQLQTGITMMLSNEQKRLESEIKLWATGNFHPKTKKIPPPEVDQKLSRHENLIQRNQDHIATLRDKIASCCYKNHAMKDTANGH